MKAAIETLSRQLEVLCRVEPMQRTDGLIGEADETSRRCAQIRQALSVLGAAEGGPIYPVPCPDVAAPDTTTSNGPACNLRTPWLAPE